MDVAVTRGPVLIAKGRFAEATKTLVDVLAEATEFGIVHAQFESRLALSEIEMKSGQRTEGRGHLIALREDVTAKGDRLIARKAALVAQE